MKNALATLLFTGLAAFVLPLPLAASEECDNINGAADWWYDLATYADKASAGIAGLTQTETARIDESIQGIMPYTRELADWLKAQNFTELGTQLDARIEAFTNAESFEEAVYGMDELGNAIVDVVDLCNANWGVAQQAASGLVTVAYDASNGRENEAQVLRESQVFDLVAATINEVLILPRDLPVVFTTCGVENAFYDPSAVQITMCYELLDQAANYVAAQEGGEADLWGAVKGTGTWIMLHEIGHALVHLLEIPITGREEDSVDNLATLILLTGDEDDYNSLFAALDHTSSWAYYMESNPAELPYWNEHSLSSQRMYDMACLIYGSDPETFAGMVGPDGLPESRAVRCPYEYEKKDQAWGVLLEPHYRE
jgi:hypothetical protein